MRISYLPATLWTVALAVIELTLSGTAWAAIAGVGVMALLGIEADKYTQAVCAQVLMQLRIQHRSRHE